VGPRAGIVWGGREIEFMYVLSTFMDSLRTGWPGDRIPVVGEIFLTRPDQPWGPPSLLCNGYWVIPGGSKTAGAGR